MDNLDARLLRLRRENGISADALRLASDLLAAQRPKDAVEVLEAHLKIRPDDVDALILSGRAELARGELLSAQQVLLQAARHDSQHPDTYRWLGEVLLRRGDPDRAQKVLARAMALGAVETEVRELHERAKRNARLSGQSVGGESLDRALASAMGDDDDDEDEATAISDSPFEKHHEKLPSLKPNEAVRPISRPVPPGASRPPVPARIPPSSVPPQRTSLPPTSPQPSLPPPPSVPPKGVEATSLPPRYAPTPSTSFADVDTAKTEPKAAAFKAERASHPPSFVDADSAQSDARAVHSAAASNQSDPARDALDEGLDVHGAIAVRADATGDFIPLSSEEVHIKERTGLHPLSVGERLSAPSLDRSVLEPRETVKRKSRGGLAWAGIVLLVGGGAAGYYVYDSKQSEAAQTAAAEVVSDLTSMEGDFAAMESDLRMAASRAPEDLSVLRAEAGLALVRHFELGTDESERCRQLIQRAESVGASAAYLDVIRAVVATESEERMNLLVSASSRADDDVIAQYGIGRALDAEGDDAAADWLDRAAEAGFVPARIAQAERAIDAGDFAAAGRLLEAQHGDVETVLASYSASLSAETGPASEVEPQHPKSRFVAALVRSRAGEDVAQSVEALRSARQSGFPSARCASWLSKEAMRLGDATLAEEAAREADRLAPSAAVYRSNLVSVLIDVGKGAQAVEMLGDLDPNEPVGLLGLASAALAGGSANDMRGASEAIGAYVARHPDDASLPSLQGLRFRLAFRLGEAALIESELRVVAREHASVPDVALALAEFQEQARNWEGAQRAVRVALTEHPEHGGLLVALGRLQMRQGKLSDAEGSFQHALATSARLAAVVQIARMELLAGRAAEAYALVSTVTQDSALPLRLARIEVEAALSNVDAAKELWDGLTDDERGSAEAKLTHARLLVASEEPVAAIEVLRSVGRDVVDARVLLADTLFSVGQTEEAAGIYAQVVDTQGEHIGALLGHATALQRGGHAGDCEALLIRAEAALSGVEGYGNARSRILLLRGLIALEKSDAESALLLFTRSSQEQNAEPDVFFHLGEALAGKNSPEARASYVRYLELRPEGGFSERARRAIQ